MGDAQLTYDGVSYGSYLGNTYANMFTAHVRALIIDGVLNPVQWATGHGDGFTVPFSTRLNSAHGAYDTLLQFFKFCKASGPGKCAFAGGDPFTKYYALLARARVAPITVNGHKRQWVRLDTGCASALQWVTSRVPLQDCKPQVAIGLAEVSIPQTQTTVEIGRQTFPNVPTGLHDAPIFAGEAGLLGNALLSRFCRVTIDAKSHHLILETKRSAQ